MTYKLNKGAVIINHEHMEKGEALEKIINLVCEVYKLQDVDEICKLIIERESKLSTGIGLGIAVPHCRIHSITRIIIGALMLPEGIDYNSVDGQPVRLILLIISPFDDISGHLACLSSVSHAVSDEETRLKLLKSPSSEELYENIVRSLKNQ